MPDTVALYTWMPTGHLHSAVELAKIFVHHGFSVAVAIADTPQNVKSSDTVASLASSNPSISFRILSPTPRTSNDNSVNPYADPFVSLFDDLRATSPALLDFLRSLHSVRGLVMDNLCSDGLDVAAELGIPAYLYYPSGASILAACLYLPTLHSTTTTSFKDMGNALLRFPGVPAIPASDMPALLLDRTKDAYKMVLDRFERHQKANGIFVNTFEWLETVAVKALRDGVCLPNRLTPPVHCVGPLIAGEKGGDEKHECLTWLDTQPKRTVVFLCFGSMGEFSVEQLKEIAVALEKSGQRFLWVVRSPAPPDIDPLKRSESRPEPELDVLLPEGFLDRTKDKGMVVKNWAPQVAVLRHEATGAFVTHCGWNSTLEAVSAGVPMVCWPLYAEQRLNKVFMVEKMKVGVEMEGYDKELVAAEEVETKIRLVMESKEGTELRERLAMAKEQAGKALEDGGSSQMAFMEFSRDLKNGGRK